MIVASWNSAYFYWRFRTLFPNRIISKKLVNYSPILLAILRQRLRPALSRLPTLCTCNIHTHLCVHSIVYGCTGIGAALIYVLAFLLLPFLVSSFSLRWRSHDEALKRLMRRTRYIRQLKLRSSALETSLIGYDLFKAPLERYEWLVIERTAHTINMSFLLAISLLSRLRLLLRFSSTSERSELLCVPDPLSV